MATGLKAELDAVEGCVPRYLYRTYSNRSDGKNSMWSFTPESPTYASNLSDMQPQQTKQMLENHFLWKSHPSDEFISWTDSLLWALQHAIRKFFDYRDGNVQICVLDTSKIETCSFFPASDLLRIYNIADERQLAHRYYSAEYLYHGGLFVHRSSSTVSLNLLNECGLLSLLPEMNDAQWKPQLCKAVEHFRGSMVSVTRSVNPTEARIALQMASLFEKEFTMPVMVALLSLRRRALDDELFLNLVADYAEPSRDFTENIPRYKDSNTEPPEIANFIQLMNAAYAAVQTPKSGDPDESAEKADDLDDLSASFGNMDATLKGVPDMTSSISSQDSTAAQADIDRNWAKEKEISNLASKSSKPKPFPARLPSKPVDGLIVLRRVTLTKKRNPPTRPGPVNVGFADEAEE